MISARVAGLDRIRRDGAQAGQRVGILDLRPPPASPAGAPRREPVGRSERRAIELTTSSRNGGGSDRANGAAGGRGRCPVVARWTVSATGRVAARCPPPPIPGRPVALALGAARSASDAPNRDPRAARRGRARLSSRSATSVALTEVTPATVSSPTRRAARPGGSGNEVRDRPARAERVGQADEQPGGRGRER